jgi:hypothetical protein
MATSSYITTFLLFLSLLHYFQRQNLQFEHTTVEYGLSSNYIQCLLQDRQRFPWTDCQDSLNLFYEHTFKIFRNFPYNSNYLY